MEGVGRALRCGWEFCVFRRFLFFWVDSLDEEVYRLVVILSIFLVIVGVIIL